jgi:hypothetical protein
VLHEEHAEPMGNIMRGEVRWIEGNAELFDTMYDSAGPFCEGIQEVAF